MATTPRYPKVSTQNLVRSPGFDFDVPSPLSQAVSRRLVEQEQADAKQADMKLSPLDKAVSALKATASMGTMLFQAIQQAPKLAQGQDAYTEAIGNRSYIPEDPKALEYMGDFGNMLEKLETEYKIPALMPELIPFQPLANLATSQAARGVAQGATRAGMAAERALDQPVTDIMNRGGRGAGLLSSFSTNPAQVVKPKGGNWLGGEMSGATVGNVDRALRRLQTTTVAGDTPAQRIPKHEALLNDPALNQDQIDRVLYQLEQTKGEAALDNWIERNVGNYIKKEMGTPEDPVRLMMDKRVQEIETQFQVDMNRAQRTRERAEAEPDPRRQANMMRQAQREEEQAKFDRDFANDYVTHLPKGELEELSQPSEELMQKRLQEGFQMLGEAKSDPAQRWENLTDDAIGINRAGDIQAQKDAMTKAQDAERAFLIKDDEVNETFRPRLIEIMAQKGGSFSDQDLDALVKSLPTSQKAAIIGEGETWDALRNELQQARINVNSGLWGAYNENKWVDKLDPETNLYSAYIGDLGLDHVIDVIKQDVAAGRIRPEQLNKLSMDQAIKRTAEFNMEQAKKMQETAIKNMEGFPTYKEYGDEGYKWVELKKPEDLTELPSTHQLEPYESIVHGGTAYRVINKETGMRGEGFKTPERATSEFLKEHSEERLADALRYEGDTMGHCVGGYCPDVLEGKSRIYSLRDKRGEPHVTVEVNPSGYKDVYRGLPLDERGKINSAVEDWTSSIDYRPSPEEIQAKTEQLMSQMGYNQTQSIRQIKGKQNAAPKEDYLPYVQDFVRSGQWSDVGDFKNTGLIKQDGKYMTQAEYDDYLLNELKPPEPPVEGMKAGGRVGFTDNPDSMMMELEDQKFQVGGIVDVAARAAKAAKAAQMKKAMKASEALAQIEGKRLNITQADRTKVGQGYLGGPGFSGLQLQEGPHKDVGAVWGVKNTGTAKTIVGGFDKPLGKEYFTTMIGSPTQHQSNQMVFDKLYGDFKREAKKGNLDPELKDKINARLAAAVDKDGNPVFPPDVDILDKDFKKIVNTFDRRAVTGNLLGGVGVGGKKGQIIDYDKVIRDTTDPFLLDAPSGSMGYRLWTPSGEIIERPDLHPAFPAILTGEDLGVEFSPAAQDILMSPWIESVRETKGRNPGYMDWTRGRPPSVEVTDKLLRNLEESGNKKGGLIKVKRKAGGGIIKKAIKAAGKAVEAPAVQRLEMSFKDVAKPVPELTEASQKLKAGRLSREEYEALVNKHKPVTPYSFVPQPATAEDANRALNVTQRTKFGKVQDITPGTPTGLRLDINAYKDHGVWVNSIHPKDMPTTYNNVSSVTNAEMVMPEEKALEVATREKNKSPFAVIRGGWNPINEEDAVAKAQEYLNHPDWVQVGIDPERHGYYYNRATMEPIVRAEEVIQIGPLVLAKKPVTAPKESFKYARGGAINADDLILTERPL